MTLGLVLKLDGRKFVSFEDEFYIIYACKNIENVLHEIFS